MAARVFYTAVDNANAAALREKHKKDVFQVTVPGIKEQSCYIKLMGSGSSTKPDRPGLAKVKNHFQQSVKKEALRERLKAKAEAKRLTR